MSAIHHLSAAELAAGYSRRALSPVEVLDALLARVEQTSRSLNAFCCVDTEAAMRQARASEARWHRGQALGPLDGVPVSIKDNLGTAGMPTRFGSLAVGEAAAQLPDSPCVERLREAGAVFIGKTTMPDFAHKILTDSPLTGITRNPWNPEYSPGDPVAERQPPLPQGLGPIAVGTDGGGSIRIPAAFTGIYGFKPSFGRVPHYPRGAFALLSHVGPMTRTVEDAAIVMNTITRPDPRDWYALPYRTTDYQAGLRESLAGWKIAFSPSLGLDTPPCPETLDALKHSARILESLGAHIEMRDPPAVAQCQRIHRVLWSAFCAKLADSLGSEASAQLDVSLRMLVEAGRALQPGEVLDALTQRGEAGCSVNGFFTEYDLVLCPVHPATAPLLAACPASDPPYPLYTPWCNQLGLPAASVYAGHAANGLPIGVQLVGRQHDDAAVLAASHAYERAVGRADGLLRDGAGTAA
ncbi:amidase [Acidovorax citrulli]|nr:amidase [Paracidovorax citrulli]